MKTLQLTTETQPKVETLENQSSKIELPSDAKLLSTTQYNRVRRVEAKCMGLLILAIDPKVASQYIHHVVLRSVTPSYS